MTDVTRIIVVERGVDVVIKEKEGITKAGKSKQTRVSNFRTPENAMNYLREKFGLKTGN